MKAKWIQTHRPFATAPSPQCEARRITKYWKDEQGELPICKRNAIVIIDGKKLCTQHAGAIALTNLVNESWSC